MILLIASIDCAHLFLSPRVNAPEPARSTRLSCENTPDAASSGGGGGADDEDDDEDDEEDDEEEDEDEDVEEASER